MPFTSVYGVTSANFAATGTSIVSISPGGQNHSAVLATGNGNAVALYFDNGIGQIVGRTIAPTGALGSVITLTTTGVQLDTNAAGDEEPVSATRLSNGNIVVTWSAGSSIYARVFDANLSPVTGEILVGAPTLAFYHEYSPDVTALANGDFVVAWQDLLASSESHIRVGRFTSTGAPVTSFTADAPTNLNDERPSIAGLADGGYVLGFGRHDNASTPATSVYGAVYNADNSVRSAVTLIDGSGAINRDVEVVANANGGFNYYYENSVAGTDTAITVLTSVNGSLPANSVGAFDSNSRDHGVVGGFDNSDGYSYVTWNDTLTATDYNVRGALVTAAGAIFPNTNFLLTAGSQIETASGTFWIDRGTIAVVYEANTGGVVGMRAYSITRTSTGSASDDVIDLTNDAFINYVTGLDGNDTVYGGLGYDSVLGGAGNDIIKTGPGDDFLSGGSGVNQLYGGTGNDYYDLTTGSDTIVEFAGEGIDQVNTTSTTFTLPANVEILKFDTSLSATGTGNEIDNFIYATDAVDQLFGLAGNDTLYGYASNDMLDGGTGDDTLNGGAGTDRLYGGTGNDTYYADSQADLVFENPGEGIDSVISATGFYLYANIENLTLAGGAGNVFGVGNELANTITGNEGNNTLLGGLGADVVHGGFGVDIVYGEDGDDQLFGDASNDFLAGGQGDDVIDGGTGGDSLYGEAGNDTLTGGTDFVFDRLVGGDGNDVLHGDSGMADYDYLYGNAGDDSFYVDTGDDLTFEQAGEGTDTVYATIAGANNGVYLYANIENLVLLGTTTFGVGNVLANTMTGNASANYLLGGGGNDVLNGKTGNDVLFGEAGADIFAFEHGTGGDVVGDFVPGTDKIDLTAIGYSWAQVQNALHENGGSTAIDLGGGDLVVLNGVTAAQLHQADFILAVAASALVSVEPVELTTSEPAQFHPHGIGNVWVTMPYV